MAIRFINTSFDLDKKVTFSYIRVIFLLIVFFSLGLANGMAWYSMKLNEIKFIELQVPVEPGSAITLTPTQAPTSAPIIDSVADWQTYRNEEYGFEFKYPQDWKISENLENDPNRAIVSVADPESLKTREKEMADDQFHGRYTGEDISVYYDLSVEDFARARGIDAKTLSEFIEKNKLMTPIGNFLTVGDAPAVDVWEYGEGGPYYWIFIEKNDHLYKVLLDKGLTSAEKQIFSTFKFLN